MICRTMKTQSAIKKKCNKWKKLKVSTGDLRQCAFCGSEVRKSTFYNRHANGSCRLQQQEVPDLIETSSYRRLDEDENDEEENAHFNEEDENKQEDELEEEDSDTEEDLQSKVAKNSEDQSESEEDDEGKEYAEEKNVEKGDEQGSYGEEDDEENEEEEYSEDEEDEDMEYNENDQEEEYRNSRQGVDFFLSVRNNPVTPGSRVSVLEACLLLLQVKQSARIKANAFSKLLKVIDLLLPEDKKCFPASSYLMRRILGTRDLKKVVRHICPVCEAYVWPMETANWTDSKNKCQSKDCTGQRYRKPLV